MAINLSIIIGAVDKASSVLDKTIFKMGKLGNSANAAQGSLSALSVLKFGAGLAGLTAAGLAMADFASSSAKAFSNLEKVYNTIEAVAPEATGRLAELQEQADKLGATTSFNLMDIAVAQKELAKQGFNVNQILGAMPGIVYAAAAADEDLAAVSETVATALGALHLEASKSSYIADLLAQAANKSNAGIMDMSEALKQVQSTAAATHQPISEIATALALLGNAGIKGSDAGSDLKALLVNVADPKNVKILKYFGIQLMDTHGHFLPILDVIKKLGAATRNLNDQQKTAIFAKIAGKENLKTLAAFASLSESEFAKMRLAMSKSDGAAKKMADTIQKGLPKAMDEAGAASERASFAFGKLIEPATLAALDLYKNALNGIADILNAMPKMIADFPKTKAPSAEEVLKSILQPKEFNLIPPLKGVGFVPTPPASKGNEKPRKDSKGAAKTVAQPSKSNAPKNAAVGVVKPQNSQHKITLNVDVKNATVKVKDFISSGGGMLDLGLTRPKMGMA